jgi:hypothetical protein
MEHLKTYEGLFDNLRPGGEWRKKIKDFMLGMIDKLKSGEAEVTGLTTIDNNQPRFINFIVDGKRYKFAIGGYQDKYGVSLWGDVPNINSNELEDSYISLSNPFFQMKVKKLFFELVSRKQEPQKIEEDGGGGGAAVATAGSTAGMGNVTSAQPASTPGAAVTGDGTTGSGDYGNPLFKTANKDGSNTVGKKKKGSRDKKKKKDKKESVIQDFIAQYKAGKTKGGKTTSDDGTTSSKMLSFNDFVNNDIKK